MKGRVFVRSHSQLQRSSWHPKDHQHSHTATTSNCLGIATLLQAHHPHRDCTSWSPPVHLCESGRARACTTEKKKNRTPAPSPCGVDKRAIRQQLSISVEKPASASHRPSSGGKIPVLERLKQAIQTSTEQEKNILIPKVGLQ